MDTAYIYIYMHILKRTQSNAQHEDRGSHRFFPDRIVPDSTAHCGHIYLYMYIYVVQKKIDWKMSPLRAVFLHRYRNPR
jgi:hypothetical protein